MTRKIACWESAVYRFVGLVDLSRVRERLDPEAFCELMETHPRSYFGSVRLISHGDGQWDPFEVWVPMKDDNHGLHNGVNTKDVARWQHLWAATLVMSLYQVTMRLP